MEQYYVGGTDKNMISTMGRVFFKEDACCLGWTDTSITVEFEGSELMAELWTDKPASDESRPYLGVLIDGRTDVSAMRIFPVDHEGRRFYPLAEGLPFGRHAIRLVKLSESGHSYVKCRSFQTDGLLLPPAESKAEHTIEFIGDSITVGFGNRCPTVDGPFCTKEEDGWRAYSALTACRLNARFSIVAHSGWAVYKSPYGGRMPDCYLYTDSASGAMENWNFTAFPSELVVVNLGTNDGSWMDAEPSENKQESVRIFVNAYVDFLHVIRAHNPKAAILCVIGMLKTSAQPYVEKAVGLAKEQGIDRLYYRELPPAVSYSSGHPSEESHRIAADALVRHIKNIMKW